MSRLEEMKGFLQEKEGELLAERMRRIENDCRNCGKAMAAEIQAILRGLIWERKEGNLVISFLRSSYITDSHEVFIAFYAGEPFVEEEPDGIYYCLSPFFEGIEEELETMNKVLRTKYIRILDAEKEEIRRWHVNQIYRNLGVVFQTILEGIEEKSGINVYYGSYMGEIEMVKTI